jgi:hypothetical protein
MPRKVLHSRKGGALSVISSPEQGHVNAMRLRNQNCGIDVRLEMKRRDFLWGGIAAVSAPGATGAAVFAARKFPSKPIRVVVPFAPGSGSDFVGRLWAETVRPHLGTVIIENQSGGAGSIGGVGVAKAKPDGHTLLVAASTTFILEMLSSGVRCSTR